MRFAFALAALVLAVSAARPAAAQSFSLTNGRTHPELRWQEAETPHFRIVFPAHLAGIEAEAAAIAESTYAVLSHNLGTRFDFKVPIYLSDEDEIVNGFATPLFGGYTMIWVHQNGNAEGWTGRHKWLRKVLAHELAHLFHIRAVRSNVGVLGLGSALPRFWTEGLAQYQTERWDSERGERWLRTAVLEQRLDYNDGGSAWNGRLLYAVGNSQVRFFAQQYGDSALARMLAHRTRYLGGLVRVHDFGRAFADATGGETYPEFEARWRRHLTVQAGARAAALRPADSLGLRLRRGAPGAVLGQYTYDLRLHPDTARWVGVRTLSLGRPVTQLVVADARRTRVLAEGAIETPVAVSPDGQTVAFSQTGRGRHGSLLADLYTVDVASGRIRRLTSSQRAWYPSFSPDGRRLAFVASAGGTANVFVRDLSTGRETPATRFTGDVQIGGLAWRPGAEQLALAVFDADGARRVHLLDLASGRLVPLTPEADDFRAPVWSPSGAQLATTSLRDGVPNVFVLDVAPDGSASAPARVTDVIHGATATAWTAPGATPFADSARATPLGQPVGDAEGRLVVLTGVTKGGDRAYLVDAATRRPEPPETAPDAYTAWETHAPPRTVPDVVPPDPSLVSSVRPYRSLANLRHVATVPFPYQYGRFLGVGGLTVWMEPLGKHQFIATGAVTPGNLDKSYFLATYRNAVFGPTIDVSAFRYPGAARLYGGDVLVERVLGAEVFAQQPLDLGRTPYTSAALGARVRVERATPLNADSLDLQGELPLPVEGTQATLTLGAGRRMQRPYALGDIHPLDGYGVRALATVGAATDARARFVRGDASAYTVLPGLGLQRLFVYGRVAAQLGESLPQDYLGLSRYDDLQLGLPSYLPVAFDRNERVRGYQSAVTGRSVAFGSAEYRVPLLDLNTTVLGLVRFGPATGALFVDAAVVGRDAAFADPVRRLGYGAELKNVVLVGPLRFGHALGWARAAERGADPEVYYRIRMGVPF